MTYIYGGYLDYHRMLEEHGQMPKEKIERGEFSQRNLEGIKEIGGGRGFVHKGGKEFIRARTPPPKPTEHTKQVIIRKEVSDVG